MAGAIDGISNFWLQIWNLLKIWHLVVYKWSYLVEVKIFKSAWIFQYFAFYGLAWRDIQILTPDLDSPENFASGEKETIQFGEGHIYQIYANILPFMV
jgi:hypothetical protein